MIMKGRTIYWVNVNDLEDHNMWDENGVEVTLDETTTVVIEEDAWNNLWTCCAKCHNSFLSQFYRYCPHCGRRIVGGEF